MISFYDERRHTSQPPTFSFQLTNRTTRSRNLEIKVGCAMLSVDGRRLFLKEEASRRRREREKAPLLRGITIITIMIMIILGALWRFHRVVKKNQLLFFIIFSLSGSFLFKKKTTKNRNSQRISCTARVMCCREEEECRSSSIGGEIYNHERAP